MSQINRDKVTEHTPFHFVTEASELGWRPGYLPEKVETDLGNKLDLTLTQYDQDKALYSQVAGCVEVTVYND